MRMKIILPLLLSFVPALASAQMHCPRSPVPGRDQSPINIVGAVPAQLAPLVTRYPAVRGVAFNTGNNIQVDVAAGDTIVYNGVKYGLREFHFHWPAEHEMAGDTFPVEIHMVHYSHRDSSAVVVGTWVRYGSHNAAWDELWRQLPSGSVRVPIHVDAPRMFSITNLNAERVFRYCGSLTTGEEAPYKEGIIWLMRQTSIQMSQAQVAALRRAMHYYARDVQPLEGRPIQYRP